MGKRKRKQQREGGKQRERGSDKFFGNSAKSDEHLKQDRSCAHVSERVRERE